MRDIERFRLREPIRLADAALSHGVIVFSPNVGKASRSLNAVAGESRRVKDRAFRACHFADELEDKDGLITKPLEW